MAIANFNIPIYSSRNEGETKLYVLDNVIDKDFEGPYGYSLNRDEVPVGVVILVPRNRIDPYVLSIPSNLIFDLEITVFDDEKINVAKANTKVTLEPSSPFDEEKNKFLENENLQQNLDNTKEEWSSIISRSAPNN